MGSQFDWQIPGLELEKQWFKKLECCSVEVLLLSLSFERPKEFCLNNWLKKNQQRCLLLPFRYLKRTSQTWEFRDYLLPNGSDLDLRYSVCSRAFIFWGVELPRIWRPFLCLRSSLLYSMNLGEMQGLPQQRPKRTNKLLFPACT